MVNDITGPRFESVPDGCPDLGIPSCLACPLPRCRYDMGPNAAETWLRLRRVADALAGGSSTHAIAAAEGLSVRAVYRLRARLRVEAEGECQKSAFSAEAVCGPS